MSITIEVAPVRPDPTVEHLVDSGRSPSADSRGVLIISREGHVVDADHQFRRATGYSRVALSGKHYRDLSPPSDHDPFDSWWNRLLAGERVADVVFDRYCNDGALQRWTASFDPIFDELGNVVRVAEFTSLAAAA